MLFCLIFNNKRYNKKNKDQIQKIEDLGLSKYSFKEYLKIFKILNLKLNIFKQINQITLFQRFSIY